MAISVLLFDSFYWFVLLSYKYFYSSARAGFKADFVPDGNMVFPAALQKSLRPPQLAKTF